MAVGVGQTANLVACRGSPQQPTTLATPRRTRGRPRSGSNVSPTDTGRESITAIQPFAAWDRSFPANARGQRLSAAPVNVTRAVARLARGALAVGEGGRQNGRAPCRRLPGTLRATPAGRRGTGRGPGGGIAPLFGRERGQAGKSDRLFKSTVSMRSSPPQALSARVMSAGFALGCDADQPQALNDAISVIDPRLAGRSAHPLRSQGSVMPWINLIALCAEKREKVVQLKCPPQTVVFFACCASTAAVCAAPADPALVPTPWDRLARSLHALAQRQDHAHTPASAHHDGPPVRHMLAHGGGWS